MAKTLNKPSYVFLDIRDSFFALPLWVQIWMAGVLMPVNMASLFFLGEPMGVKIAFFTNIALLLNLPILLIDRGFSKRLAIPHLLPWTVLIGVLIFNRPVATGLYGPYLWLLLIVNMTSLAFDYPDTIQWMKGNRAIAIKE